MIRAISLILTLALGGCASMGPREKPTSYQPVCEALVGPLRYTSKTKESRRYAGPDLAADLAVRNRVGKRLRCPAYR